MRVAAIVALTRDGVIGRDNTLPWKLPADLKRFRALTTGFPIVMGRKTYESIGKPLPNRLNIVITRSAEYPLPEGVARAFSLGEALAMAEVTGAARTFVIGGGEIFKLALAPEATPPVDELYLTWIDTNIEGDAYFPLDLLAPFAPIKTESHVDPFPHAFVDYARKPL